MKHLPRRHSGFTLIEILVVLAIAALLGSILFTAFRSVSENNKKTSCQGNLVQIYQATRLYAQDFNGEQPYFNPPGAVDVTPNTPARGLGLWALYAYPASTNVDCDGGVLELPNPDDTTNGVAPLASYVKSPNLFHCPYDSYKRDAIQTPSAPGCQAPAGSQLSSDALQYVGVDGKTHLNPYYLSYQGVDDFPSGSPIANAATYSSFRAPGSKKQLIYYSGSATNPVPNPNVRSKDTTIIAWCRFHRKLDGSGNTVSAANNYDNVLFADGTVQYIPTSQIVNGQTLTGWNRLPQECAANPLLPVCNTN